MIFGRSREGLVKDLAEATEKMDRLLRGRSEDEPDR